MRHALIVAAAVALSFVAGSARGTVLYEVPIEDMAADAEAIVLGEVVQTGVRLVMLPEGLEPFTVTTIKVDRWLSGRGGETVEIHERGGVWQGGGVRIEGTPVYRVRERVVVFLSRDDRGNYRTYGMVQGKFVIRASVDGPTRVERDFRGAAFARWQNGQMQVEEVAPPPATLSALLARIERVVEVTR